MKALIRKLLRRCGKGLAPIMPGSCVNGVDLAGDLGALITAPEPVLFDIGANQGQTIELLREAFPHPRIFAFEPQSTVHTETARRYADERTQVIHSAVGAEPGTLTMRTYANSQLSSFLELNLHGDPDHPDEGDSEEVSVTTIDHVMQQEGIDRIHLLKSDTQGFETEVFKGAEQAFQRKAIDFVLVELIYMPQYEGQADPLEIMAFLQQRGLYLIDIYEKSRSENTILWCTALFGRRSIEKFLL